MSLAGVIFVIYRGLVLIIIADVLVSWFLDPFHQIRRTLDSIVQPMLAPIQRFLRPAGGVDFSPLVLIILIELIGQQLIRLVS